MNEVKFKEGLAVLQVTFPRFHGFSGDPEHKDTYAKVLYKMTKDLSDAAWDNAVATVVAENRVTDYDNLVAMILKVGKADGLDAHEQFDSLCKAVWGSIHNMDHIPARTLEAYRRLGGKKFLFGIKDEEVKWKKKEFLEVFKNLENKQYDDPRPRIGSQEVKRVGVLARIGEAE